MVHIHKHTLQGILLRNEKEQNISIHDMDKFQKHHATLGSGNIFYKEPESKCFRRHKPYDISFITQLCSCSAKAGIYNQKINIALLQQNIIYKNRQEARLAHRLLFADPCAK